MGRNRVTGKWIHPARRRALATALVVAGLLLAAGCEREATAPPPPPPPDVVVADVVQRDVPVQAEWVGVTDGNINAQIRARVRGYLETRAYTEGSLVRTGDRLFKIDARPYKAALDQALGDLGRARAALTKTEQDVRRYTPLAAEGAISQQELDNAVQANRGAVAAVESAEAAVEKARLDLGWTEIRSPIEGIAGISVAQVGDLIDESTVLTTVSQVDPIKVSFAVSEKEYLAYSSRIDLRPAADNRVASEGTLELILADGSVHPQRGTATVANREIDRQTGTMQIVGQFPNPDNRLRPGLFAKVRATLEQRQGALLVPEQALQEVQGSYQLAVVDAQNTVHIRPVEVGPRVDAMRVIASGLNPGERVVVEGLQKVRQGVTVNPRAAAAE